VQAVEADGLTRTFGTVMAVDGLAFALEEGRVLGVLGPNGAGKTTAIRMLTTILAPSSGRFTMVPRTLASSLRKPRSEGFSRVCSTSYIPGLPS